VFRRDADRGHDDAVPALPADVHFVFQPLVNLRTGGIAAVEAQARTGTPGGIRELLRTAADTGQLTPTDFGLAAAAIEQAGEHGLTVPLQVNLLAVSATRAHVAVTALLSACHRARRSPAQIVVELGAPFSSVPRAALHRGLTVLRDNGFRIALDGVGDADAPLRLLGSAEVDLVKLDRGLAAGAVDAPGAQGAIAALVALCGRTGAQLAATGVSSQAELDAVHRLGVVLAQGDAVAPASRRPRTRVPVTLPAEPAEPVAVRRGPTVTGLMRAPFVLTPDATADEVREAFAADPELNCVVLADHIGRPQCTIDRNRFLLAVAGPYGHALNARRGAKRLADPPREVPVGASVTDLLDVLAETDRARTNDDVVVVDAAHRCAGVVRVTDLVRAVTDSKVEQAAALNPLTRLPGTDTIGREVDRRILAREVFAVGWLDVDGFKTVNDEYGFAAGDDLIRQVGSALRELTAESVLVGHVGGDDFLFVSGVDDLLPVGARLLDEPWSVDGRAVSVSLAALVCVSGSVRDYREVSALLAPLKRSAKGIDGPAWVVGRAGSAQVDVLRGDRPRATAG
jgi:EAL domain-containing protein (putative c-di-GMP-specific phosphodiesterase class I)/GGDEF domain-containing protein